MTRDEALGEVAAEANRADDRYGPPASAAEGYGVLAEEMAELLEVIRQRSLGAVRQEAIQVAAVAVRLAEWADGHIGDDPDTVRI